MKRMKRLLCALFSLCLLLSLGVSAMAAGRSYTIRIYAGAQGSFPGETEHPEYLELTRPYQYVFTDEDFNLSMVNMVNGKYYVKGIRESGKENVTYLGTVTRDQDYVVLYGVRGQQVSATIEYVEAGTGRELYPSKQFFGNVGDKPVVGHHHIDSYQPRYYNLTKTLSANEAENVFRFEYSRVQTQTGNDNNANNNNGQQNPGATPAPTESPAPTEAPAQVTDAPEESAVPGPEQTTSPEPEEIGDLDTPLVGPGGETEPGTETEKNKLSTVAVLGIAAGALAVVGGGLWLFLARRKRNLKNEE